jgi:hypothetical protein
MPLLDSKAWMAIYRILADRIHGGQEEVEYATSDVYYALLEAGALKKRAQ